MTDNTERDPMSTLTELIAEALLHHQRIPTLLGPGRQRCTGCDHLFDTTDGANSPRVEAHRAQIAAAVVADWLESTDTIRAAEDAHPERGGSCCFNMGQPGHRCPPYVTSASMSAALAAEARKGARRD